MAELLASLQAQPSVKRASEAAAQLEAWKAEVAGASKRAAAQAETAAEALPGGELRPGRAGPDRLARAGGRGALGRRPAGAGAGRAPEGAPAAGRPGGAHRERPGRPGSAPAPPSGWPAPRRPAPTPSGSTSGASTSAGCGWRSCCARWSGSSTGSTPTGEPQCLILHGHGTGALKQALREALSTSPYVAEHRRGDQHEGGDAVTIVTLARVLGRRARQAAGLPRRVVRKARSVWSPCASVSHPLGPPSCITPGQPVSRLRRK